MIKVQMAKYALKKESIQKESGAAQELQGYS